MSAIARSAAAPQNATTETTSKNEPPASEDNPASSPAKPAPKLTRMSLCRSDHTLRRVVEQPPLWVE